MIKILLALQKFGIFPYVLNLPASDSHITSFIIKLFNNVICKDLNKEGEGRVHMGTEYRFQE